MAKLTEHKVVLNGIETTMLLDENDVDRYRAAGALTEEKATHKAAKPEADKAMSSPANK